MICPALPCFRAHVARKPPMNSVLLLFPLFDRPCSTKIENVYWETASGQEHSKTELRSISKVHVLRTTATERCFALTRVNCNPQILQVSEGRLLRRKVPTTLASPTPVKLHPIRNPGKQKFFVRDDQFLSIRLQNHRFEEYCHLLALIVISRSSKWKSFDNVRSTESSGVANHCTNHYSFDFSRRVGKL